MKDLIISLAVSGREDYATLVKGLEASIEKYWSGDVRIFKTFPDYVTPHSAVPYKFKFDLIKQAVKDGYKRIWWMDSTMRLNKDITVLSNKEVVAFHNLGHPLYKWISDEAVYNLMREGHIEDENDEVYRVPMLWGGIFFFDFDKPFSHKIFNDVYSQIELGSFNDGISKREGFIAHRHDQAVMSIVFYNYGIQLLPYGTIASKQDATEETYIIYGS